LQAYLKEKGVESVIHYPRALPNLPAYKYLGTTPADFPVATKLAQTILSLPMYPELKEKEIKYVAECISQFYNS
jgi:dTDP-4-amino-4,6-dideoxygalactose transaminase